MREVSNRRNPILPLEYHVPDSEGHVMPDGKLYVYGSFDDREDVYCSEKYHVVSTADMEHWTIHEESLNGNQIPWFNNPVAPKYSGIDWSHPTPFIQKMIPSTTKKNRKSRHFSLHRIVWNVMENIIFTFACRMTVKELQYQTDRRDHLQIQYSFRVGELIRQYLLMMMDRHIIIGDNYFHME